MIQGTLCTVNVLLMLWSLTPPECCLRFVPCILLPPQEWGWGSIYGRYYARGTLVCVWARWWRELGKQLLGGSALDGHLCGWLLCRRDRWEYSAGGDTCVVSTVLEVQIYRCHCAGATPVWGTQRWSDTWVGTVLEWHVWWALCCRNMCRVHCAGGTPVWGLLFWKGQKGHSTPASALIRGCKFVTLFFKENFTL